MYTTMKLTIVFALIAQVIESRPSGINNCAGRAVDVVFVLDASSSIQAFNFQRFVRPFVRDVIAEFDIGPAEHQTRVGVVTFNHDYQPLIDLGSYLTPESLTRALDMIVYTGGNTFSSKALEYVADDMFREERGARRYAESIIVLVTDGKSRFPEATREEAEQARAKGVHIFAIGVGNDVVEPELKAIASDPDSRYMFHVRDYRALYSIKQLLAMRACEINKTPTTENPQKDRGPEEYCGGKPADVYFLLDVSSSVWLKNFTTKVLPFVKDMASIFDIGPTKTRIGVATFSHKVNQVISLDQYTSRDQLINALNPRRVRYTGGRTFTSSAIAYVRENGFSSNIARPGVAQVLIIITDGISYDPVLTKHEAEKTKRKGVYIFSIGVGPYVDYQELNDVSSDPDDNFVFKVKDYSALSSIKNILAIETCSVEPSELPPADYAFCNMGPTDVFFVFESFSKPVETRTSFRTGIIKLVKQTFYRNPNVMFSAITDPCLGDFDISFTSLLQFKLKFSAIPVPAKTKLSGLVGAMKTKSVRDQRNRKQVGVIFLDDSTTDLMKVVMEARRAQSAGIELYVVAIGKLPSRTLDVIGSNPARDHVIVLDNYSEINLLSEKLGKKMCS